MYYNNNNKLIYNLIYVNNVTGSNPCHVTPSTHSSLQVRQHTEHQRTFLYLEQLILAQGADAACVNVKQTHQGLNFYFANRSHALRLVDFLSSVAPCKHRDDKQLVSHDTHSNTYNYKYTFSLEIVPVCKVGGRCLGAWSIGVLLLSFVITIVNLLLVVILIILSKLIIIILIILFIYIIKIIVIIIVVIIFIILFLLLFLLLTTIIVTTIVVLLLLLLTNQLHVKKNK